MVPIIGSVETAGDRIGMLTYYMYILNVCYYVFNLFAYCDIGVKMDFSAL
jgi:hypothetical protein